MNSLFRFISLIILSQFTNVFAIQIQSFNPVNISGGMNQTITITGNGFGNSQNSNYVSFYQENGQYSDANTSRAFNYLQWTDTKIQLKMPAAFSNKIKLNINGTDYFSIDTLHVLSNLGYHTVSPLTYEFLTNNNKRGGYTWYMHTSYFQNTEAKIAIEEVFKEFRCKTGANYVLSTIPANVGFSLSDTFHIIAPDPNLTVVGFNDRLWTSCVLGSETFYSIQSQDIRLSDKQNWYYGKGQVPAGKTKFRYVLMHELGHSLGLGHVNEFGQTMYPSVSLLPSDNWSSRDSLTSNERDCIAGFVKQSREFSFRACGVLPMENVFYCQDVYNTKSRIDETMIDRSFTIYPNPCSDMVYLYSNIPNIISIKLFNVKGKLIKSLDASESKIDVSSLPVGLYCLSIETNLNTFNQLLQINH